MLILVGVSSQLIQMVSHSQPRKVMKNSACSYLLFVPKLDQTRNEDSLSTKQRELVAEFKDSFLQDLPKTLLPKRPKDLHIDLIPSSSPPNRLPYRVSKTQQEEIQRQAQELLKQGLIQPNNSHFCSTGILYLKDGSCKMCVDYKALNNDYQEPLSYFENPWDTWQFEWSKDFQEDRSKEWTFTKFELLHHTFIRRPSRQHRAYMSILLFLSG